MGQTQPATWPWPFSHALCPPPPPMPSTPCLVSVPLLVDAKNKPGTQQAVVLCCGLARAGPAEVSSQSSVSRGGRPSGGLCDLVEAGGAVFRGNSLLMSPAPQATNEPQPPALIDVKKLETPRSASRLPAASPKPPPPQAPPAALHHLCCHRQGEGSGLQSAPRWCPPLHGPSDAPPSPGVPEEGLGGLGGKLR